MINPPGFGGATGFTKRPSFLTNIDPITPGLGRKISATRNTSHFNVDYNNGGPPLKFTNSTNSVMAAMH